MAELKIPDTCCTSSNSSNSNIYVSTTNTSGPWDYWNTHLPYPDQPISFDLNEKEIARCLDLERLGMIDTESKEKEKENETMMNSNMFNGIFGKIAPGMCRLSMSGKIAIKTTNGYKAYNIKTGRLTNCDNFAFDIGEDFFFVIPTNKVERGDIILAGGKPRCVLEVGKNEIKTFCYEDSSISTIVPEHHMFMGKNYFYGKIISMFGDFGKDGSKGMNKMMKFMMMNEMMKGNNGGGNGGFAGMLPMMFMMNSGEGFFDGMFDMDVGVDEEDGEAEEE